MSLDRASITVGWEPDRPCIPPVATCVVVVVVTVGDDDSAQGLLQKLVTAGLGISLRCFGDSKDMGTSGDNAHAL